MERSEIRVSLSAAMVPGLRFAPSGLRTSRNDRARQRRDSGFARRAPRNDREGSNMSQDLEQLTALNDDYVAAVQNCDVKRFDEILAPEFYCSNPDKTLVDRAASWSRRPGRSRSATCTPTTSSSASSATSPSSTPRPATPRRTASRRPGDTPIAGRSRRANGWRCRPTCRGEGRFPVARMERSEIRDGRSATKTPDCAPLHPGYEHRCHAPARPGHPVLRGGHWVT